MAATTSSTGQVSRLQQTTERLRHETSQLRERLRGERDAVRALRAQHAAELRAERTAARRKRVELQAQLQEVNKTKNTLNSTSSTCEQCSKNRAIHEAEIRKLNAEFKKKEQQLKGQLNEKSTNTSLVVASSCEQCATTKALHEADVRKLASEFKKKEQQLKGQLNDKVAPNVISASAYIAACEQCAKFKAMHDAELRKINVEFKKKEHQLKCQLNELRKSATVDTDGGIQSCHFQRLTADLAKQKEVIKDLEDRLQKAIDADRLKAADLRAQHEKHVAELSRITRANRHDAHKLLEELKTKDRIIAQLRRSAGKGRTKGEDVGNEHAQMRKLREEVRKNEQPALLPPACDPKPETVINHDKFRQNEVELNVSIKQRDQMVCGAANEELIEHPETDTDSAVSSAPSSLSPQPCSPAAAVLRDHATPPPTSLSPQPSEGYTTPPPGLWPDLESYDDDDGVNSELAMAKRQVRELERALLVTRATKSSSRHVTVLSERVRQLEDREAELLRELGDLREQNELLEFRVLELAECPDKSSISTSNWSVSEHRDVATATDDIPELLNDEPVRTRIADICSKTDNIEDKKCLLQVLMLLHGLDELNKRTEIYDSDAAMQIYNEREVTPPVSLMSVRGARDRTGPDRDRLIAKVPPFTGRTAESDDDRESPLRSHESSTSPTLVNSRGTQTDVTEGTTEEDSTKSLNLTTEVRKLDKLRETIDRNGRLVVSGSGCVGGCEQKHLRQLEFYRERVDVLERKLCVYESSGELQARQLAERLSREVRLEAQVKQLTSALNKLQSENSRLEEERCELEEAENDTRLRCQRLETDILQLERSRMAAKRRSRENRQQAAYWETMVSKYEERNYELEERECELRHRLEVMEKTAPAILLFNMWKMMQDDPKLDVASVAINRLKRAGSRGRSSSSPRSKSRSPQRKATDITCTCGGGGTEGNVEEKIRDLEDQRNKLVEAKQDMERKVHVLESQLNDLKHSATITNITSPSSSSAPYSGPSASSLMSGDFELITAVQELKERENDMKKRIEELEKREAAYMETLQQADEIWAEMETGYKKRISDAEQSEANMRDRLRRLEKREPVNYDELDNTERELAAQTQRLSRDNNRLQIEKKRLENELQCLCRMRDEKTRELETRMDRVRGELDYERRRSQALEQRLSDGEAALAEASRAHSAEVEALRERLARTSNELVHLEVTNGELREEVETLEGKIAEVERGACQRAATDEQVIRGLSQELNDRDRELADMKQQDPASRAGERLGTALQGVKTCDVCSHTVSPNLVQAMEGVRTLCNLMSHPPSRPPDDTQVRFRSAKCNICDKKNVVTAGISKDKCLTKICEKLILEQKSVSKRAADTNKDVVCAPKICEQDIKTAAIKIPSGPSSKASSVSKLSSVDLESSGPESRKTSKSGVTVSSATTDDEGEVSDHDTVRAEAGDTIVDADITADTPQVEDGNTPKLPSSKVCHKDKSSLTCEKKSCTGTCSIKSQKIPAIVATSPGGSAKYLSTTNSSKTVELCPIEAKLSSTKSKESTCIKSSCTAPCINSSKAIILADKMSAIADDQSIDQYDLLTEVMVAGQPEYSSIQARVDMDTDHEIDGVTVMASVTDSGNLELTTESPPGLIEHTMMYTPSGNMEITTGFVPRAAEELDEVPSYFQPGEEPIPPDIKTSQEPLPIPQEMVSAEAEMLSAEHASHEPSAGDAAVDETSATIPDSGDTAAIEKSAAFPLAAETAADETSAVDETSATIPDSGDTAAIETSAAFPLAADTAADETSATLPDAGDSAADDIAASLPEKISGEISATVEMANEEEAVSTFPDTTSAEPGILSEIIAEKSIDETVGTLSDKGKVEVYDDSSTSGPGILSEIIAEEAKDDGRPELYSVISSTGELDEPKMIQPEFDDIAYSETISIAPESVMAKDESTSEISVRPSFQRKNSTSSGKIRRSAEGSGDSLVELLQEVAYSTEKITEILNRVSKSPSKKSPEKSEIESEVEVEVSKSSIEKISEITGEEKISKELLETLSDETKIEKVSKELSEKLIDEAEPEHGIVSKKSSDKELSEKLIDEAEPEHGIVSKESSDKVLSEKVVDKTEPKHGIVSKESSDKDLSDVKSTESSQKPSKEPTIIESTETTERDNESADNISAEVETIASAKELEEESITTSAYSESESLKESVTKSDEKISIEETKSGEIKTVAFESQVETQSADVESAYDAEELESIEDEEPILMAPTKDALPKKKICICATASQTNQGKSDSYRSKSNSPESKSQGTQSRPESPQSRSYGSPSRSQGSQPRSQGSQSQPRSQGSQSRSQGSQSQPRSQESQSQPRSQGSQPRSQESQTQPRSQGSQSQPRSQGSPSQLRSQGSQPRSQGSQSQPRSQGSQSQQITQGSHSQPRSQGSQPRSQGSQSKSQTKSEGAISCSVCPIGILPVPPTLDAPQTKSEGAITCSPCPVGILPVDLYNQPQVSQQIICLCPMYQNQQQPQQCVPPNVFHSGAGPSQIAQPQMMPPPPQPMPYFQSYMPCPAYPCGPSSYGFNYGTSAPYGAQQYPPMPQQMPYQNVQQSQAPCSVAQNQVPYQNLQDQVPYQTVQNQVPYQTVQNQVPYESIQSQAPCSVAQNQVPYQNLQDQVPYQTVQQQVPYQTVQNQVPYQTVQNQVPYQRVQDQIPYQREQDQAPYQTVQDQVSYQTALEQVPYQNIEQPVCNAQEPIYYQNAQQPMGNIKQPVVNQYAGEKARHQKQDRQDIKDSEDECASTCIISQLPPTPPPPRNLCEKYSCEAYTKEEYISEEGWQEGTIISEAGAAWEEASGVQTAEGESMEEATGKSAEDFTDEKTGGVSEAGDAFESTTGTLSVSLVVSVDESMSVKSDSKNPSEIVEESIESGAASTEKSFASAGDTLQSDKESTVVTSGPTTKESSPAGTRSPEKSERSTKSPMDSSKRTSVSSGSKIPVAVSPTRSSKSRRDEECLLGSSGKTSPKSPGPGKMSPKTPLSGKLSPGKVSPKSAGTGITSPKSNIVSSSGRSSPTYQKGNISSDKESGKISPSGVVSQESRGSRGVKISYHGKDCSCKECKCNPCKDPKIPARKRLDLNAVQSEGECSPTCHCEICRCKNCIDPRKKQGMDDGSAPHTPGLPCDCEECECAPCKDPNILAKKEKLPRSSKSSERSSIISKSKVPATTLDTNYEATSSPLRAAVSTPKRPSIVTFDATSGEVLAAPNVNETYTTPPDPNATYARSPDIANELPLAASTPKNTTVILEPRDTGESASFFSATTDSEWPTTATTDSEWPTTATTDSEWPTTTTTDSEWPTTTATTDSDWPTSNTTPMTTDASSPMTTLGTPPAMTTGGSSIPTDLSPTPMTITYDPPDLGSSTEYDTTDTSGQAGLLNMMRGVGQQPAATTPIGAASPGVTSDLSPTPMTITYNPPDLGSSTEYDTTDTSGQAGLLNMMRGVGQQPAAAAVPTDEPCTCGPNVQQPPSTPGDFMPVAQSTGVSTATSSTPGAFMPIAQSTGVSATTSDTPGACVPVAQSTEGSVAISDTPGTFMPVAQSTGVSVEIIDTTGTFMPVAQSTGVSVEISGTPGTFIPVAQSTGVSAEISGTPETFMPVAQSTRVSVEISGTPGAFMPIAQSTGVSATTGGICPMMKDIIVAERKISIHYPIPSSSHRSVTVCPSAHPVDCDCVRCICNPCSEPQKPSSNVTFNRQQYLEPVQLANVTYDVCLGTSAPTGFAPTTTSTPMFAPTTPSIPAGTCPYAQSVQVGGRTINIHYPRSASSSRTVNVCQSGHPVDCACVQCICDPCSEPQQPSSNTTFNRQQYLEPVQLANVTYDVCSGTPAPTGTTLPDVPVCPLERSVRVADRIIAIKYPISNVSSKSVNVCPSGHPVDCQCVRCVCSPCSKNISAVLKSKEPASVTYVKKPSTASSGVSFAPDVPNTRSASINKCPSGHPDHCQCIKCICDPCIKASGPRSTGSGESHKQQPNELASVTYIKKHDALASSATSSDNETCVCGPSIQPATRAPIVQSTTNDGPCTCGQSVQPITRTAAAQNDASCTCGPTYTSTSVPNSTVSSKSVKVCESSDVVSTTISASCNATPKNLQMVQHSPLCDCAVCKCNPCAPPEFGSSKLPPSKLGPALFKSSLTTAGSSKYEFEMAIGQKAAVRAVAMTGTEDLRNLDTETLKRKLTELENEAKGRANEIAQIRKFMSGLQSQCTCGQIIPMTAESRSFEQTISGLQCALAFLQEKCRKKDRMITAFTEELRLRTDSGVFDSVLHKIAAEKDIQPNSDYDRTSAANRLPTPGDKSRQVMRTPAEKPCAPVRPVKDDGCQCSPQPPKNVDPSPLAVTEVRRIAPDSLLLKWERPASQNIRGYEVEVNGEVKSRVHSAGRNATVLNGLVINGTMNLAVIAISVDGDRCSPAAKAVYQAHQSSSSPNNFKEGQCVC